MSLTAPSLRLPLLSPAHCAASARLLPKQKLLTVVLAAASSLQVKGPKAVTGTAIGHEADGRPGVDGYERGRGVGSTLAKTNEEVEMTAVFGEVMS